jgi:hypothetical protein
VEGFILQDLSRMVARSNPDYDFIPFEHLSEAQRAAIGHESAMAQYAGVLVATSRQLNIKAVSSRLADLFAELRVPRAVNAILVDLPPRDRDATLARLVLDGVLELDANGRYLTQAEACNLIVEDDTGMVGDTRLAALSVAAIKHGQRLGIRDPGILAARLYFYHRLPATPRWRKLWPDTHAVLRSLDAALDDHLRRGLVTDFAMTPSRPSSQTSDAQWISWHRRIDGTTEASGAQTYKLYVSPAPQHVGRAFANVVALLPDSKALSLKIGSFAHGLLRPDKFVVYFGNYYDLAAFAERLVPAVAGILAHGVPFSATIDDDGMLSWGIDPPRATARVGHYADDSWRMWLCNRLAVALTAAPRNPEMGIEPWRYALTRLWLSGVDTRTWTWRTAS